MPVWAEPDETGTDLRGGWRLIVAIADVADLRDTWMLRCRSSKRGSRGNSTFISLTALCLCYRIVCRAICAACTKVSREPVSLCV